MGRYGICGLSLKVVRPIFTGCSSATILHDSNFECVRPEISVRLPFDTDRWLVTVAGDVKRHSGEEDMGIARSQDADRRYETEKTRPGLTLALSTAAPSVNGGDLLGGGSGPFQGRTFIMVSTMCFALDLLPNST